MDVAWSEFWAVQGMGGWSNTVQPKSIVEVFISHLKSVVKHCHETEQTFKTVRSIFSLLKPLITFYPETPQICR